MTSVIPDRLSVDLSQWPGIVVRVSSDGEILESNGSLEALTGSRVVGTLFTQLLDHDSSLGKWNHLRDSTDSSKAPWELMLNISGQPVEPRAFSMLGGSEDKSFWLIEQPSHFEMSRLTADVAAVNSELVLAQRLLVVERSKLAHALSEVERSNKALDEFAYAVSHDLKAPLRGIALSVETAGDFNPSDEVTQQLSRIEALASRMRRMIDAALEYARAGRTAGHREQVDTRSAMLGIVEFIAPPDDVDISVAWDLPTIETERVPFEQIFRNLISNAVNHRDKFRRSRIDISAISSKQGWTFTVADNGPGIPEAMRDQVFRLFQTSRSGDGTGLGLALVKRTVQALGGSVSVETSLSGGAAFKIFLPADGRR